MKHFSVNIQFGGFYNSIHSYYIENAIETYNSDDNGNMPEKISETIYDFEYSEFYGVLESMYADVYVDMINEYTGADFEYKGISSPRFYNLSTDEIMVNFERCDLYKAMRYIIANDLKSDFRDHVNNVTSSKSGYVPFYTHEEFMGNIELVTWAILTVIAKYLNHNELSSYLDMNCIYEQIGIKSNEIIDRKIKGMKNESF